MGAAASFHHTPYNTPQKLTLKNSMTLKDRVDTDMLYTALLPCPSLSLPPPSTLFLVKKTGNKKRYYSLLAMRR